MALVYFACQGREEKKIGDLFGNINRMGISFPFEVKERRTCVANEIQELIGEKEGRKSLFVSSEYGESEIVEKELGISLELDEFEKNSPQIGEKDVLILADFSGSDPRFFTEGKFPEFAKINWRIIAFQPVKHPEGKSHSHLDALPQSLGLLGRWDRDGWSD